MALDRKDYKTAIPQLEKRIKSVEQVGANGLAKFDVLQEAIEKEILTRTQALLKTNDRVDFAIASADGKSTVYHSSSTPTGGTYKVGDTWFDASHGYAIHTWNGTSWVKEELGTDAIEDLSIVNAKIANGTIQSAKIGGLDVGKLTGGYIDAGHINTGAITVGSLQDGANYSTTSQMNSAISTAKSDAEKVATNYIKLTPSDGIQVHNASDEDNYVQINSGGMQVYKNNENVASFGETITLGSDVSGTLELDSDSITMLTPSGVSAFSATASGTSKTLTKTIIFNQNISYNSGSFTLPDMPSAGTLVNVVALRNGRGITQKKNPFSFTIGTSSSSSVSFTYNSGISGAISYTRTVNFSYDAANNKISYTSNGNDALILYNFVYNETADVPRIAVGGDLYIGGHATSVGTVISDNFSKSISSGTDLIDLSYSGDYATMTAGSWLINCSVRFPSSSASRIGASIYINGSSYPTSYVVSQPVSGGVSALTGSICYSSDSNFSLSFGARQNSGASLAVTVYFDAIRIA